jgi:hypothetical protein
VLGSKWLIANRKRSFMKRTLILTTLLSLCCGGAQEQVEQAVAFSQIEKKVLIVISHENFRDEEFKEPYSLLVGSGVIVTIASTDTSTATGMLGMNVKPDIILEQVNPEDFDALVVVGGTGCRNLWNNTTLHNIIQSFNITKKTIAAICIGPVVLGKAGILEGMWSYNYELGSPSGEGFCSGSFKGD